MRSFITWATAALCTTGVGLAALPAAAQTTERVSVASDGTEGDNDSLTVRRSISADGRYVAFLSSASNLAPGGNGGHPQVYVRDRATGTTERVSRDASGNPANCWSHSPDISGDGRYVAFFSCATNLVGAEGSHGGQGYIYDRTTQQTELLTINSDGQPANDSSFWHAMSTDGRYVAFYSPASNLAPGGNGRMQVYLRDRQAGTTERISRDANGNAANCDSGVPGISADGRFVGFVSCASNLVVGGGGDQVYLYDRIAQQMERVSVDPNGQPGNSSSYSASISADGRYVAFLSIASNLLPGGNSGTYQGYLRDRQAGTTERVSRDPAGNPANCTSGDPAISADGRYVTFSSCASNLVAGGSGEQVYVYDRAAQQIERVSVNAAGEPASNDSSGAAINANGRYVAFSSRAGNLAPGDGNGRSDVFVRDRGPQEVIAFGGFEKPLENLPFTNVAKAGSILPIKWQLTDENGDYIRDLDKVRSLKFASAACDWQDEAYANAIDGVSAGASGLRYDSVGEHFVYSWDTHLGMRDTCAVFILTLADNQQHFARFMLK